LPKSKNCGGELNRQRKMTGLIERYREFLKHNPPPKEIEDIESDQQKKVPPPPLQQPFPNDVKLIDLVSPEDFSVGNIPLIDVMKNRRSHRQFSDEQLTIEELSFLLWATQGVQRVNQNKVNTLRTVPSAGARHPFETYLVINRVKGLDPGLYRYLPLNHKIYLLRPLASEFLQRLTEAAAGQTFISRGAVVFIWTVVPYRAEWRYLIWAHKASVLDAGHVCQNLYLACEAIGSGTCAVAAYDQKKMDTLLGVDGKEEFTIYIAPVGKIE
jgi:SagB-type dehydrogenase family enzyme